MHSPRLGFPMVVLATRSAALRLLVTMLSLVSACALPGCASNIECTPNPQELSLADFCLSSPSSCQLAGAAVSMPGPGNFEVKLEMASQQTVTVDVSAWLAQASANPRLDAFLGVVQHPQGDHPNVDDAALQISFDGFPATCPDLSCLVPTGVSHVGFTYTAPTPSLTCSFDADCCLDDFGPAASCDGPAGTCGADGRCALPVLLTASLTEVTELTGSPTCINIWE